MNEAIEAMCQALWGNNYAGPCFADQQSMKDVALALADHFDAMAKAGVRHVSSGIAADAIRDVVGE